MKYVHDQLAFFGRPTLFFSKLLELESSFWFIDGSEEGRDQFFNISMSWKTSPAKNCIIDVSNGNWKIKTTNQRIIITKLYCERNVSPALNGASISHINHGAKERIEISKASVIKVTAKYCLDDWWMMWQKIQMPYPVTTCHFWKIFQHL